MLNGRRLVALTLAAGVAGAIGVSGVAAGAGTGLKLVSPRPGARVHAGAIRLVVHATGSGGLVVTDINVNLSPHRRLNRQGFLIGCRTANTSHGCDYLNLSRWAHHPGDWTAVGSFNSPGYWAVTPGRYYWQAVQTTVNGDVGSRIGSFRVVG